MSGQRWDSAQMNAIFHRDGPLLVAAGPGAGKTSVIISHVNYLISQCHVHPESILVVTFTKAAAQEMKERYLAMSDSPSRTVAGTDGYAGKKSAPPSPRFGTMHSVFFEILRKSEPQKSFCFINDMDRDECLKSLAAPYRNQRHTAAFAGTNVGNTANLNLDLRVDEESEMELIRRLTAHMSRMVNASENANAGSFPGLSNEAVLSIFHNYQAFKHRHGLVDFDDILLETWRVLREDPEAASYWQQKYRYILIDEFQDINDLQYQCMHILEAPWNNLYVVGDEDQSIYGFRGSSPSIIQRFLADHPGCRTVTLENNYRAPDVLLAPARNLIRHNRHRTEKNVTGRPDPAGADYQLQCCSDQWDEYRKIAETARLYLNQGIALNQQVILLRSFRNLPDILLCMQQCGIPTQIIGTGSIPNQYEAIRSHFITKDILAYFQLAQAYTVLDQLFDKQRNHNPGNHHNQSWIHYKNGGDILSLLQRIRPISLPHVSRYSLTRENPLPINPQGQRERKELEEHLSFLSALAPYPALEYILKAMGYEMYLSKLKQKSHYSGGDHPAACSDILMILKNSVQFMKTQREFIDFYSHSESALDHPTGASDALQARTSDSPQARAMHMHGPEVHPTGASDVLQVHASDSPQARAMHMDASKVHPTGASDALQIRTMHSSKGLEYDVVYIPELNKGIIPDSRSVGESIEEERRLLYVAMTRARRHLQMYYVERIRGKQVLPSTFVKELFR